MFIYKKKKNLENYTSVRFTCLPRKILVQAIMEGISKQTKNKKVSGKGQHGLDKGKNLS